VWADTWIYPTLADLAASLAPMVTVPSDAELWTKTSDMPILREDAKDAAEIEQIKASTISSLTAIGFTRKSVIAAVVGQDMTMLEEDPQWISVQLQAAAGGPAAAPPALPAPAKPPAVEAPKARAALAARAFDPSEPRDPHSGKWGHGTSVVKDVEKAGKALEGQDALDAAPVELGRVGFERGAAGLDHRALAEYRASGFQDINEPLRKGNWETSPHAWMVHDIDTAMGQSKLTHDVQVHRGVSSLAMFGPAGSSSNLTGMVYRERAYASTTADPAVAGEFVRRRGNRGKNPAILTITVPKGTGAVQLSGIGAPPRPGSIRPTWNEGELLLQRGLTYRITGDGVVDGVRQLDVEVVSA
jgi:hypothetical protein